MKYLLLVFAVCIVAGCSTQMPLLDNSTNITQIISTVENLTQNITNNTQNIFSTVENITQTVENITSNVPAIIHNTPVVNTPNTDYSTYSYFGNPLDLFKSNTVVIFGNSGSLVAATINLESYIGTVEYKQDDNGELPAKNVILLGNCTNSYIAGFNCNSGVQLFKKDYYVLIISYDNPADVFAKVNEMILPGYRIG